MTQENDKQEKPKAEPRNDELPDAELDKVSGGAEPVGSRITKPSEPVNTRK